MSQAPHPQWKVVLGRRIDELGRAGGFLSMIIGWLLAATVTYDVILRALDEPTLWASEVSIYLMLGMAFVGVGATYDVDGHFRVSFIRDLSPPRVRAAFDIFSLLISLLFAIGFTYGAWRLAQFSWRLNFNTSTILEIPMWILQGLLVLGGVLLTLAVLRDVLRFSVEGHRARDSRNSKEVI